MAVIELDQGSPDVQAWAATAMFVHELDTVQYDGPHEGPCLTSVQTQQPSVSGSLGSDQRWPRFGGRVARMGVHSVIGLPLIVRDKVVGTLSVYAFARNALDEHAVRVGSQIPRPVALSVHTSRLLAQAAERASRLQRALASRAVIDQAIGIIRSRTGADAEEAFARLIRISQAENAKLHLVADRLVDEAVRRARARHQSP